MAELGVPKVYVEALRPKTSDRDYRGDEVSAPGQVLIQSD